MRKMVVAFATSVTIGLATTGSGGASGIAERALVQEINRVRMELGLRPLLADERLERAARSNSLTILERGRVVHADLTGRLRREGVRAATVGENVAWVVGMLRARRIVSDWLASPVHRANVLRPEFRRIGIGAVEGHFQGFRGARIVTVDFAGA